MTSEIAIANKVAVALAADSAVTIQTHEGHKVFNTANKLFALSKYRPVGIMVYGNAEFMDVPWELIVKTYRRKLGLGSFATLEQYARDFLKFLEEENTLVPESRQEQVFFLSVSGYFAVINAHIMENVESILAEHGTILDDEVEPVVVDTIQKHYQDWDEREFLPSIPENYVPELIGKYGERIHEAIIDEFGELPIPEDSIKQLEEIAGFLFSKDRFPASISGIAVAGFGEEDDFPVIASFTVNSKINNKLHCKENQIHKIGVNNSAAIIPFAQSQMVVTFMEGIDPFFRNMLETYLLRLFDEYPDLVIDSVSGLGDDERKEIAKDLREKSRTVLDDFLAALETYGVRHHVGPIIDAVAVLPKDDLAEMAESLVSLTSFKQRVSLDIETVGGPIDVAVISKGDGFIWIKRKHYFDKELNPHFFALYYHEDER